MEIAIYFEVINVSTFEQTIFEVRTVNNLPSSGLHLYALGKIVFRQY